MPDDDISNVFRPRALPLATEFNTSSGEKNIWTTFSDDQIDLNFKSKALFVEIIKLLLFYVDNGAKAIRLDAIGFMWKELGTNCMHLPKTHEAIQLYKTIFDAINCGTLIITETNVPHKDNISYFGNGHNEAQLVYNFSLPPLVLYSIIKGDAKILSKWASSLKLPSSETTFFNFLSSHDGIGVVPTHGILTDDDRAVIEKRVIENGGFVSYKNLPDGSKIPYEMNINYFDAVSSTELSLEENVNRFLLANSVLLSIVGVPAVYIHSILGSENYLRGVEETGMNRSINREKLNVSNIEPELATKGTRRNLVFDSLSKLLKLRSSEEVFHPNSKQEVFFLKDEVLAIRRGSRKDSILYLANFSSNEVDVNIEDLCKVKEGNLYDIITGKQIENSSSISLNPYQFMWIK